MLGKLFLTLDAIGLLFGAPIADYNHTHIFNPRWPPHAKFHGAQTITLSVLLGLATLYYTWRPSLPQGASTPAAAALAKQRKQDALNAAVFTGTIYWAAGLASILYPGTDGIDPEFGPSGFPQAPVFVGFASAAVLGWMLERRV
ncbi:hypothetical protein CHGG_10618 [Chaetomium globosum CBS 148.51]|uniref:Uncharacterized protein n=1 Tax=Chaetomium globosum (strain ATCC 6205 / CBS 148.51 / DSM 1962 / NBRC 6347 / NRRL 1970) TaxID=306901 RepID=Q2GN36_CHAGB|nr:uncharacterized protein CHGG_10618 [Chaetomium globosum CBS 148.51]EAQ84214.1 hypothetical protein CHGG_10618 [Chaetomium globosum CBS 148.51]